MNRMTLAQGILPTPVPTDRKKKEKKIESTGKNHNGLYKIGGITILLALLALGFLISHPTTQVQIPAQQSEQTTGTEDSSLKTGGQETTQSIDSKSIDSKWYSVGAKEYRLGEKFQFNGINFIIQVAPNGRASVILISTKDSQKLINSEQTLLIKIKFRAKGTNEVFETPVESFSGIMAPLMKGWTETLGSRAKNLLPSDIEWQPEFGKKNKFND